MRYSIHLQPDAIEHLDCMRKYDATNVLDGIEKYLSHQPFKQSKSRIKKLKGIQPADYRLRIDDWRIFYRIGEKEVQVLRILNKEETKNYYEEET